MTTTARTAPTRVAWGVFGLAAVAAVGLETLVGRTAVVVRALSPRGQVKLDGEVWEACAEHDLLPGDEVVVRSVDGLVLVVEPT